MPETNLAQAYLEIGTRPVDPGMSNLGQVKKTDAEDNENDGDSIDSVFRTIFDTILQLICKQEIVRTCESP